MSSKVNIYTAHQFQCLDIHYIMVDHDRGSFAMKVNMEGSLLT